MALHSETECIEESLFKYLDIALQDDPTTSFGGVSFLGETVADFLESVDCQSMDGTDINTINELNAALQQCGIKPIKR